MSTVDLTSTATLVTSPAPGGRTHVVYAPGDEVTAHLTERRDSRP